MLTDEDKKIRATAIGGSEIAALIGRSRFKTPIDVYRSKVEVGYKQESNPLFALGHDIEPGIIKAFCREMNYEAMPWQTHAHPTLKRVCATPDAMVWGPGETIENSIPLEVKWVPHPQDEDWGPSGTDLVPDEYLIQVQQEMGVAESTEAFLAALLRSELRIYRFTFSPKLFAFLANAAEEFWAKHIETKTPPPLEASKAYADWLSDTFANRKNKELRTATEAEVKDIEALEFHKKEKKVHETYELERSNRIRAAIGEGYGLSYDGGKVLWTGGESSTKTDWKALAEDLLGRIDQDAAQSKVRQWTTNTTTARQLRLYPKEK